MVTHLQFKVTLIKVPCCKLAKKLKVPGRQVYLMIVPKRYLLLPLLLFAVFYGVYLASIVPVLIGTVYKVLLEKGDFFEQQNN